MPSFVIHLAIAEEYMKKHKNEIKNKEEFRKGVIAPDITNNKYESHYDNYKEKHVGLLPFLKQNDININSEYGKGYFMHLLSDELFYHNMFKKEYNYIMENDLDFYNDYDCLNDKLLKKYKNVKLPKKLNKYAKVINEKPKYLKYNKIKKFIKNISKISIEKQIKEIKINGNPII